MNWLLIATIAQIILGTSAVFDKFLLKKKFFDPLVYTFWLGILGIFAVVFLPFGFVALSLKIIIISLVAGAIFILAMLFLYYALDYSEASGVLPALGGFSPVFTLLFSYFLLSSSLSLGDFIAFFFLVLAGIILFFIEKKETKFLFFVLITASSSFFGLSNVLSKIVFDAGNFVSGFFWIKMGGIIFVLLLLFIKSLRQKIFFSSQQTKTSNKFLYFGNRAYAGFGSVLVYFSVSLAHPALVDATQSLKYIVIFLCAWVFLKESFRGKILTGKIIATFFVILGILTLGLANYSQNIPVNPNRKIEWGITFSQKFSQELSADWRKSFEDIINELNPSKIRLIAYWDEIEREKGKFNFSDIDWQIQKTEEKNIPIVIVFGIKTPRWPECHKPPWAGFEDLIDYIKKIVNRYKNEPNLYAWQIENEPFLYFGECGLVNDETLKSEIDLVRSLDPMHPIIITDGGEIGLWYKAAKMGDIFGTTMYRNVYNKAVGWLLGNIDYPLTPNYFKLKEKITRLLIGDYNKRFIVIELQAEPWSRDPLLGISYEDQTSLFSFDYFKDTIQYAKDTGFNEYYLWGVEWWYYLKQAHNDPRYWNYAKELFLH